MLTVIRRQLTVALPNRPGALAEICEVFRTVAVNIDAISVIDNVEQGMVRLLTSEPNHARAALQERGFYVVEADVLEVEVPNRIGVLGDLTRSLATANINIDYAYGTEGGTHPLMRLCFKVSDPQRALQLFESLPRDGDPAKQ